MQCVSCLWIELSSCHVCILVFDENFACQPTKPWSSLVEGDEKLDRPNSQTTMNVLQNFWV